jgi:RHS repeat-associated protein
MLVRDSGCWAVGGYNRYDSSCSGGYLPLITQVDVTDPRGYVERMVFGTNGYPTSDTHALGQPEQQVATYSYYADNLLKSVTDTLGRVTSFDYDSQGNTTRITRLDGTPNAVTSTFSYNGPFGQLSSATDPLGHASTFLYDTQGNLTTAADPLNQQTHFAYDAAGRVISATDALNNTSQFSYFGGDLASVQDPLGNVNQQFMDAIGRVISTTDAQGHAARLQFNGLNLLTQTTDAQGHIMQFSYDQNGNPVSLTDALNHTIHYSYDNMDHMVNHTDSLLRSESYTYDANGNIISTTDRKGQVTTYAYDPLNRLKFVGFGTVINQGVATYESTISYTYDAGNRLVQSVDSAGGTITEVHDDLDRLTSETTARGTISYVYDFAGRRTSMAIAGQPAVNYTYDIANRLMQITQGTATTAFGYDSGNRRISLTLPNGVTASFSYDQNSRLTGITYQFGTNTLGTLAYVYDQLGRRIQVGGSMSRTGLPQAVVSAAYDAANELTNWNGIAVVYDSNGNMTNDGSNLYTWDARGQLTGINGSITATFSYDAKGRRLSKNVDGQNTGFSYNGGFMAQEFMGATVTANILNGGTSFFQRSDANGSAVPITDALGSVLALADANGNLSTQYTYDPFGNTVASGSASSNPFQYAGQENDGTGLYYMHARYYNPALMRFISEDPLGFGGGDVNLHAYAGNSPATFRDPTGLSRECPFSVCGGLQGTTIDISGRKNARRWWEYFWHALWLESPEMLYHHCKDLDAWCDKKERVMGEIGIDGNDIANGFIVTGGGGIIMGAAEGLAGESIITLRTIAGPIIENSELFACDFCAEDLAAAFRTAGYRNIKFIEAEAGAFDTLTFEGQTISTAGYHIGVEVDGFVFDNMVNGMPVSLWKQAIKTSGKSAVKFISKRL